MKTTTIDNLVSLGESEYFFTLISGRNIVVVLDEGKTIPIDARFIFGLVSGKTKMYACKKYKDDFADDSFFEEMIKGNIPMLLSNNQPTGPVIMMRGNNSGVLQEIKPDPIEETSPNDPLTEEPSTTDKKNLLRGTTPVMINPTNVFSMEESGATFQLVDLLKYQVPNRIIVSCEKWPASYQLCSDTPSYFSNPDLSLMEKIIIPAGTSIRMNKLDAILGNDIDVKCPDKLYVKIPSETNQYTNIDSFGPVRVDKNLDVGAYIDMPLNRSTYC